VLSPGSEIIPDLREAGDFAVLGLTETKIKMDDGNPGVTGNVGLGPNSEGEFKSGFIAGTLFVDPAATIKELKIAIDPVDKELTPAVADALRASSDAAALAPTQTYQDIKETRTIEADGNLTVLAVNKIELKDGIVLTLRGGPGDTFVINIADNLKLENGSAIRLDGDLQPSNVLFNLTKMKATGEIKTGSSASGIFLAPGTDAVLKIEDQGTTVEGTLIAGKEISIKKDAQVR